jgi:hypothetical protein
MYPNARAASRAQVAEEVYTLARVVRTFGTEAGEVARYARNLGRLRRISVRLATAYLLYLVTNASLFNLTKARRRPAPRDGGAPVWPHATAHVLGTCSDPLQLHNNFLACPSNHICHMPFDRRWVDQTQCQRPLASAHNDAVMGAAVW